MLLLFSCSPTPESGGANIPLQTSSKVSYLQAQQDVLNGIIDCEEANDTNLMRKKKQTYCAMCVCAWEAAILVMDVFICGISRGTCYATAHKMWRRCLGRASCLN